MSAVAVSVASLALAAPVPAGQPARFSVEQDQVLLTYQASLGRQQISGVSRALTGAVEEAPGGGLRISARATASSFQSGSPGVDALFARALESERFPDVEFEGAARLGKRSGQFTVQLEGTLSLHGVAQRLVVPVKVLREGKTLFVQAAFPLDLESFGVAAPSIAGVRVSPQVQVELKALLHPAPSVAQLPQRG